MNGTLLSQNVLPGEGNPSEVLTTISNNIEKSRKESFSLILLQNAISSFFYYWDVFSIFSVK
jgi:hypothetical protein